MINKGYLTANSSDKNDEFLTPKEAVEPLLKYIESFCEKIGKSTCTIWCPFDTEESEYVKIFKTKYNVIYSHINNGQDFFVYTPENYDLIISNPPFSKKDQILKRLYELNNPFAVLLPLPTLQGQKRFKYLKDCQALIFDKRINFKKSKNDEVKKGVSFASIYICKNFLPKDLIFEELIVK